MQEATTAGLGGGRRHGQRGREGEYTLRLRSQAAMASGESPVRFLVEKKTNEGERLEEEGEENRGEKEETCGDSSARFRRRRLAGRRRR